MSQIVNLALEELTLGQLEFQMVLSEALKLNVQAMQVLFLHLQKDNHFIQVNQAGKSCSFHPGSSGLTFGTWPGHYKAQMACVCTQRSLGSPW